MSRQHSRLERQKAADDRATQIIADAVARVRDRAAAAACEECGNDDPCEGHRLCSDCLPLVGT